MAIEYQARLLSLRILYPAVTFTLYKKCTRTTICRQKLKSPPHTPSPLPPKPETETTVTSAAPGSENAGYAYMELPVERDRMVCDGVHLRARDLLFDR